MIKTDIILPIKYTACDIREAISRSLPVAADDVRDERLVKRTLSLSSDLPPHYRATVAFSVGEDRERGLLKLKRRVSEYLPFSYTPPAFNADFRPVVVGAGPAGLFAALTLAESGARPILIERGLDVETRKNKLLTFQTLGILDPECNVQFGEGGAGTYSDGKLKVGAIDKYKARVLDEFIAAGADESIAYSSTAHLGTDKLSDIVKAIRCRITDMGGEIIFGARFCDFSLQGSELNSISYEKDGERVEVPTRAVILAIGHSARDTISMLFGKGLPAVAKGFGIGVRIEHPRDYINGIVYGKDKDLITETASYHLVTHLRDSRSVYSFCMCPGGTVVAATSEKKAIVTNGMSEYSRMGDNSNAAFLVSVTPADFPGDSPLSGIELQRRIERRAFSLTSDYRAPAQRLDDFLAGRASSETGSVKPSYPRGTELCETDRYLPDFITNSLRQAVPDFDDWMCGFYYPDAIITGPETRTTSPVRFLRDEANMAEGFKGIFPAGEGAGYAGGIVSSAVDGIRTAERLILSYTNVV